jgi:hypothetical protein
VFFVDILALPKKYKMKKVLTLMFVASLAFGAVSCSKDYNCECTAAGALPAQTIPIADASKSEATDACDAAAATRKAFDATATCELK